MGLVAIKNNPYQSTDEGTAPNPYQARENLSRLTAYFAFSLFSASIAFVIYATSYVWGPLPIKDELVRFWLVPATASWILGTCLALISCVVQRTRTSLYALGACMFAFYWPMAGWGIAWQL